MKLWAKKSNTFLFGAAIFLVLMLLGTTITARVAFDKALSSPRNLQIMLHDGYTYTNNFTYTYNPQR